jgi:hypothetical protein
MTVISPYFSRRIQTVLVGLPEQAVKESTHRIERAMVNSGFVRPQDRVVINLDRRVRGLLICRLPSAFWPAAGNSRASDLIISRSWSSWRSTAARGGSRARCRWPWRHVLSGAP